MNPQITEYIDQLKLEWQADVCRQLREIVLEAIPDVEEKLQYSKPHYRKNGKYAAVIGTAKGWVSLTIFNAQNVQTPDGLFESSENGDRKTIKIRKGQAVDAEMLKPLIQQATSTL
jgi:hypothetical protein